VSSYRARSETLSEQIEIGKIEPRAAPAIAEILPAARRELMPTFYRPHTDGKRYREG
jgi:hypothetical protein